jgi:RNA-binding protein
MLNNNQKRHLRSLAHSRKPVIIVGDNGLTLAVLSEAGRALTHHELIKIRLNAADREIRAGMIERLCKTLQAELVQRVGHTATLFRRNPEAPRIQLP